MTTHHGSCFCGAVAFTVEADLTQGTMRCNCRFCRKMRYWELMASDPHSLKITQGDDDIAETPTRDWREGLDMHHRFCRRCGTRLWSDGHIPEMGGDVLQIFVPALDDLSEADLVNAATDVKFADGAHDNWLNPPAETRHL